MPTKRPIISPPRNSPKLNRGRHLPQITPNYSPLPQEFGHFGDLIGSFPKHPNHATPDQPITSALTCQPDERELFTTQPKTPVNKSLACSPARPGLVKDRPIIPFGQEPTKESVPEEGLEPTLPYRELDFESSASAIPPLWPELPTKWSLRTSRTSVKGQTAAPGCNRPGASLQFDVDAA